MENIEERNFKVDDNIIYHLIKSQSSSKEKAIIELIQNSYDAGASLCKITINELGFICEDNGKGFNSKKEIEDFFETFGKEHDNDQDNRFGRFRMGRGQIMALAKTKWISKTFEMDVDIKNNGLKYNLSNNTTSNLGTVISGDWYNPISKEDSWYGLEYIINEIKGASKYIRPMKIYLNENLISFDKTKCKFENADFYYIDNGSKYDKLTVYNLGVLVQNFPYKNSLRHIKGTLISKKHLNLNTSRNEILDCEVWKRIVNEIKLLIPYPKTTKVSVDESKAIITDLFSNRLSFKDILKIKLFKSFNSNKGYSLFDLANLSGYFTFDDTSLQPDENVWADKMLQKKIAIVLSKSTFPKTSIYMSSDIMRIFFDLYKSYINTTKDNIDHDFMGTSYYKNSYLHVLDKLKSFDEMKTMIGEENYELLNDEELNEKELCAIKAFRKAIVSCRRNISKHVTEEYRADINSAFHRKIYVGNSLNLYGWTDGDSYIVLNRHLLRKFANGIHGSDQVVSTWLHEVCHTKGKTELHDIVFYEKFHYLVSPKSLTNNGYGVLSYISYNTNIFYAEQLKKINCKVPLAVLRSIRKKIN